MSDSKSAKHINEQSLESLVKDDADLKVRADLPELLKKWNTPASDEALARAVKALEDKKHKVTVVADAAAALKVITDAIPEKGSFYAGGSQTLQEIGYVEWAKSQTKAHDYKAEALAAMGKGDWAGFGGAQKKGFTADVFISSAAAVSETGDITWGSLTGSRLVLNGPTSNIIVVGTNKIVPTYDDAVKRLYEFQLPIESARIKLAFKVFTGSNISDFGALRGGNPFGAPGKVHVVFIKGAYGF